MKFLLKISAIILFGSALWTWGSYNLKTGETFLPLLNMRIDIGKGGYFLAVITQVVLGLLLWMGKKLAVGGKAQTGEEYLRFKTGEEYYWKLADPEPNRLGLFETSKAAKITVPYLELLEKKECFLLKHEVADESALPLEKETLKDAFKVLLHSKDIHTECEMPLQDYKQACLTSYFMLSRFLPDVGSVRIGSEEFIDKYKDEERSTYREIEKKYKKLAKNERNQLFSEIEYFFPFGETEEITSFEMDIIVRAARLGKYCLPGNSIEAAEHVLQILGRSLFKQLMRQSDDDIVLDKDFELQVMIPLLGRSLFHDKPFDVEGGNLMQKVSNKGEVYSAKGVSFVTIISLCSHYMALRLNTSGDKIDFKKLTFNVSSRFLRFLEDDDKDKLIKLGIEKAQETFSSAPPTDRAVRLSELTHKFCMSKSQKEDAKCFQIVFEVFHEILKEFQVRERLGSGAEPKYDGEI